MLGYTETGNLVKNIITVREILSERNNKIEFDGSREELVSALKTLTDFITPYLDVDFFGPNGPRELPDAVKNANKKISEFTAANSESVETIMNGKVFIPMIFIELYSSEGMFKNVVNNIDIERIFNLGKKYMPEFIEKNPNFKEILQFSFTGYDGPFELQFRTLLDNEIGNAVNMLNEQLNSDEFANHFAKLEAGSVNKQLIENFKNELTARAKGEDYDFLISHHPLTNANIQTQLSGPFQRITRYQMLLKEINKEMDNSIPYDHILRGLDSTNILKDIVVRGNQMILNPESKEIKSLVDVLGNRLAMINENVFNELDVVKKAVENIDSIETHSSQSKGYQSLIEKLELLKASYNNLKPGDNVPTISHKLKEMVIQVKSEHPGFKINKEVKAMFSDVKKFDTSLVRLLKNDLIIRSVPQLDTVQKMQLNMLDEIINKLESELVRLQNKTKSSNRVEGRKEGLNVILESIKNLREEVDSDKKLIYSKSEKNLEQKIKNIISEEQNKNPLLNKGLFSNTAKALKEVEKYSEKVQKYNINRALTDKQYAIDINGKVNKHTSRLHGEKAQEIKVNPQPKGP